MQLAIERCTAQGREQGIKQATKATIIESIVLLLDTCFEVDAAATVKPALEAIDDLPRLKHLLQAAIQTQSLDAFITTLQSNGAATP